MDVEVISMLLPLDSNTIQECASYFVLEKLPFQKGFDVQENKKEVTKVTFLVKMVKKRRGISSHYHILSDQVLLHFVVSCLSATEGMYIM